MIQAACLLMRLPVEEYIGQFYAQSFGVVNVAGVVVHLFLANRRTAQLGMEPLFDRTESPFPWMSEVMHLRKGRNFFETREIW